MKFFADNVAVDKQSFGENDRGPSWDLSEFGDIGK